MERTIQATIRVDSDGWCFQFVLSGAETVDLTGRAPSTRTDELWKHTCFEIFILPIGGEAYFEFNFSPTTEWAAYAFDSWREGQRNLNLTADPQIAVIRREFLALAAGVDLGTLPEMPWQVGLSAVIEEKTGHKSYWALAHPPSGPPDFHHPACFTLELPPAPAA